MITRLFSAAVARSLAFGLAAGIVFAPSLAVAQGDLDIEAPQHRVLLPVDFNSAEDLDNILLLDLSTGNRVAIRLMPSWAPNHVERIKTLAKQGFYDGVIFHRVIEGFMAQTGDPTGTGQGGSWLPDLENEFNSMPHVRGSVAMARAQSEDSANSQFFIVFYPRFALDRKYTNFGRVISGMPYVDEIERGEPPANPTKVLQASLASEGKGPPVIVAPAPPPVEFTAEMLNNSLRQSPPAAGAPAEVSDIPGQTPAEMKAEAVPGAAQVQ